MPDTPTDKELNNPELQKMYEDVLKEMGESQCVMTTCEPCAALRSAETVMTALRDEVARLERQNISLGIKLDSAVAVLVPEQFKRAQKLEKNICQECRGLGYKENPNDDTE